MNSPPNKFKDKIDPLYKAIDENIKVGWEYNDTILINEKKIEEMIDLLKGIQIKVASGYCSYLACHYSFINLVNLYGDGLDILNWKGRSSQLDTSKGLGEGQILTNEPDYLIPLP